jgi:hypothetical protein
MARPLRSVELGANGSLAALRSACADRLGVHGRRRIGVLDVDWMRRLGTAQATKLLDSLHQWGHQQSLGDDTGFRGQLSSSLQVAVGAHMLRVVQQGGREVEWGT